MTVTISEIGKRKLEQAGFAYKDQPRDVHVGALIKEQQDIFQAAIKKLDFVTVPEEQKTPAGIGMFKGGYTEIMAGCLGYKKANPGLFTAECLTEARVK
ncbi:MAG: hypothetical protein ACKVOE_08065 [Rickettsiales bacterium]